MKLKGRFFYLFLTILIVSAILSALFLMNFFAEWQYKLSDHLYSNKAPLNNVVIIAIDDKSIQGIGRWPWDRDVWARIINNIENPELIAIDIGFFEGSNKDYELAKSLEGKNVILASEFIDFEVINGEVYGKGLMVPVFNTSYAYINVIADNDGVARNAYLGVNNEPSFAEKIYENLLKRRYSEKKGLIKISFAGPPGTYKTIPAIDLYNNSMDFKGKVVLIGATAQDLHDSYFVPTSKGKQMPGVEIHANILQTLITKDYIQDAPKYFTILSIIFFAIITATLVAGMRVVFSSLLSILLIILYVIMAIVVFSSGYILNLVYPVLSVVCTYAISSGVLYITEEKKKKEIIDVFGKYVSKNVVEEMFKGDEVIDLKGVEKEITILFADIRGFTTLSEKLHPHDVVKMLSKYLGRLTEIVFKYEGTLDKYMGDALMAIYNAPKDVKDHAVKACRTALEMQRKITEENKGTNYNIFMGIGINTGKAVVGNVGSEMRKEYTAIGDSVNLASRVEGLTRVYGVNIIITESVYQKVKEIFICRDLDMVKVKGKTRPCRIFELRDKEYDKEWDKAVDFYRKGDFLQAKRIFDRLKDKDPPSMVFSERCSELAKLKPKSWDGVFEFKAK